MSTEPKYLHPSTTSRIINNAVLTLSASGLSNQFLAIESEKGPCRKATYITTTSEYQFNFGDPNYSKYGQSGINAIQWLRAGGGLWVIRVVPDDETYSSLSIGVGYNAEQQYTNDAEEFVQLSMTADQISLWNAEHSEASEKLAKGLSTKAAINQPLFYARQTLYNNNVATGEYYVNVKLGQMTKDAIKLYNKNNGIEGTNDAYEAYAGRKVSVIIPKLVIDADKRNDDTNLNGFTESSLAAFSVLTGYSYSITAWQAFTYDGTNYSTPVQTSAGSGIYYFTNEAAAIAAAGTNGKVLAARVSLSIPFTDSGTTTLALAITAFKNFFGDSGSTSYGGTIKTVSNYVLASPVYTGKIGYSGLDLTNIARFSSEDAFGEFKDEVKSGVFAVGVSDSLIAVSSAYTSAEWNSSFEIYDNIDKCSPVSSSVVGATAFTEDEKNAWNIINANQIILGNDSSIVVVSPYIKTAASTGAVTKTKTFFVSYSSSGEIAYSKLLTTDEIEYFNAYLPSRPVETQGQSAESAGSFLESQYVKNNALLDASMKFSASASVGTENTAADLASFAALSNNGLASLFAVATSGSVNENTGIIPVAASFNASTVIISKYAYSKIKGNIPDSVIDLLEEVSGSYKFKATATTIQISALPAWAKTSGTSRYGIYAVDAGTGAGTVETHTTIVNMGIPNVSRYIISAALNIGYGSIMVSNNKTVNFVGSYWNASVASVDNINYVASFVVNFVSTKNKNTRIKLADIGNFVTITGTANGEYVPELNYAITNSEDSSYEPDISYMEAFYQAVGFVSTVYTGYNFVSGSGDQGIYTSEEEDYSSDKKGYDVDATNDIIDTEDKATFKLSSKRYTEFLRFIPKGSGKWYNNLAVSFSYDNSFDNTYPDWSMFKLEIIEKSSDDSSEIIRETFSVSLDPDAISGSKESLFVEDVVNRYSSYLKVVFNYDNLENFIKTKLAIVDAEGNPVKDEDDNVITPVVDDIVKYIFNQITLAELNERTFGADYAADYASYLYTDLMSSIGYDSNSCFLDSTLFVTVGDTIEDAYAEPFVSHYYMSNVSSNAVIYLGGGSYGNGWEYEYTNSEDELDTTASLDEALVKAYNGSYDAFITNTLLSEFDIVMDCNYGATVKTAMSELSSLIRQDCLTILDMNLDCANATQAIAKRKNEMSYDTYFTMIFSQHIVINDEWSGKPIKVTPTFFLASKIPQNDASYGVTTNFVGPRRGTISGFTSISWLPTEPEKTELYKKQINYIETDSVSTQFATELTTQNRNTPLSLGHAVRALLKVKREMEKISRNYRSEFASTDIYNQLQSELTQCASKWVLAGGFDYISPVINTSTYDRQQRIARVNVDVAFTDIIERFVFDFVVNR